MLNHDEYGAAAAAIAVDAAPCHDVCRISDVTELNDSAADANSAASPSQARAAANIGPDPAPEKICAEVISGGKIEKFIEPPWISGPPNLRCGPITRATRDKPYRNMERCGPFQTISVLQAILLTSAERTFSVLNMRSADLTAVARIRDAAIEQFGEHGFGVGLRSIAEAAGVSAALVIHHFGSKDGLRKACDEFVSEEIRSGKSETIQSRDPATWLGQMAEIESYAPLMAYLVRSMQSGGELAKMLWQSMIDNVEAYMEEGVQAGTVKPSRDPHARARYLAITGGGGFLLYLQMHETPNDLRAVLRDYASDMVLPALEVYSEGLLTDRTMYDAFLAEENQGGSHDN